MKHEISGEGSREISAYKLPICDPDTERRNFPGYQTHSPGESLMNQISEEGTTETRKGSGMNKSHSQEAGEMKRRFS